MYRVLDKIVEGTVRYRSIKVVARMFGYNRVQEEERERDYGRNLFMLLRLCESIECSYFVNVAVMQRESPIKAGAL